MHKALHYFTLISLLIIFILQGCSHDPDETPVIIIPQEEEVPNVYYFERDGHHNIFNSGQVCRNLIIQDFEILVKRLAEPGAVPIDFEDLYKYYDNGGVTISGPALTVVNMPLLVSTIYEISSVRDLKGRVYGPYANKIHADMEYWCATIAENSHDPSKIGTYRVYIDEETGHDMVQMFKLTAMGGVMWQHGLHAYFHYVENDNNDTIVTFPGVTWLHYTWMEHHLDEVYGYYGAARKFHDFTDEDLAAYAEGGNYLDNFQVDGKLDFSTEYNFLFARLAAERDLGSQTHTDYSKTIFDGFYDARVAIVEKDYDKLIERKAVILDNWEKVVASSAVHHLNEVIRELDFLKDNPGASPERFYLHWSAMFKYTEMLRYNYDNRFTGYKEVLDEKFITSAVPFPKAIVDDVSKIIDYKTGLLDARALIQGIYDFDTADVENW